MSPELAAKLRQARRRLNASRFLRFSVWSSATCLLAAAGVVLLDKWTHWGIDPVAAGASALAVAVVTAGAVTWFTRKHDVDTAAEIDQAFNLKERVTTLLTLPAALQGTGAALALQEDVHRRTETLVV